MSEMVMAAKTLPVEPKSVVWNPTPEQLRAFAAQMPNARPTEFGNLNVGTRVVSRSKLSTFIATDRPEEHSDQTITRAEYDRIAKLQDDYIREQDMLVIEGYIGNDPEFRVPARLIIEKANANIAAMQAILYYPATSEELAAFEPTLTVIYTPNLAAEDYPENRLIAVDLENKVTRVFHSDYFGESKKGGLRMWNQLVYERGGLALHSGCKVIPVGDKKRVGLIVGPFRYRQDHDDVHEAERFAAGAGRFLCAHAGRQGVRDRERLLRENVRPQSERRADDLPRLRFAARVSRERISGRQRQDRLLRHVIHAERPRRHPHGRHRRRR